MEVKERTRQDIEARLKNMGDYVKLDYLQRALQAHLDFDTRKFVLVKLSNIYQDKGMVLEAARMMKSAADINTTFKAKMDDYMKSVELFIKGGNFQESDLMFAQALALANDKEKPELKNSLKRHYSNYVADLVKKDKRLLAKKAYEKMLTLDLNQQEREQVKANLLSLYEKLGNIRDFYRLRDGNTSI